MTPNRLLVTGGGQRPAAARLDEEHRFQVGNLIALDFSTGQHEVLLSRQADPKRYPISVPNVTYTSCSLVDGRLCLCTETEIFLYSYPGLVLEQSASHPCFQNIHHVAAIGEYIGVVSTGLDMVVLLDEETLEPVRFINTLGKDPWHRFSPSVDYRKVHSTKPHESHPNYLFTLGDDIWVTRFKQKDAANLSDLSIRIDIGIEHVHDGHVAGDHVFFTCVDGKIVVANRATRAVEDVIDLHEIEGSGHPLGWCRGLLIEGNEAYVGFSRLRKTAFHEHVRWVLRYTGKFRVLPTRIVRYDLARKRKLGEVVTPPGTIDALYSVLRDTRSAHGSDK